ncbi:O-fucosyltransferase 20-like [Phoenix dactylifera]|uniref:O-fucosyltransferase family protein n=1 Tax=Phoenix dactylifera TaxID=42345 RepID=A0A8B7D4D3_PHODC|nr:O-fucosyltransferase 20-like [Phoenix dactylifera]
MARSKTKQLSYIAVPSQVIHSMSSSSLQNLILSPKKYSRSGNCLFSLTISPKFFLLFLFLFALVGTLQIGFHLDPLLPFSPMPCSTVGQGTAAAAVVRTDDVRTDDSMFPITAAAGGGEWKEEFWSQPEGMGYRPCLEFSKEYRRRSKGLRADRRRYLLVVVSGGVNQQRNQIVDAVVIARILGAALVVPILQVNVIWGDESEFSDIFDLEHFKRVLADDVRVVSSLPSTHIMTRPVEEKRTPLHVSPRWIRSRYLKRLNREGVLLLRGLDSRLSKDLPPDLQKLRCKVAFEALRFSAPIVEFGNELAMRMRSKGPYLALHVRMEKDVWVRTGCLPGLSPEFDEIIQEERKRRPELLTARSNMTYHQRKLAGLCPLNALEVTRLLKALGAPKDARIYWAGGEPFGGPAALQPLTREFSHFYSKENLSLPGELEPFANKSSLLAAIDYIVCEQSDAFMPSHGGNMGHLMRGHRAFAGHKKFITPNKRQMLPYFLDTSLPESEFHGIIKELHKGSLGQPEFRKVGRRDVTAYPVPECMCNNTNARSPL